MKHFRENKSTKHVLKTILFQIVLLIIFSFFHEMGLSQTSVVAEDDAIFKKYALQSVSAHTPSKYYIIKYKQKECYKNTGLLTVRKINNSVAIVKCNNQLFFQNIPACIEKYSTVNDNWKLSPSLEKWIGPMNSKNEYFKFIITATNINRLISILREKKINFEIISVLNESQSAIIKCSTTTFYTFCLPEPELIFADKYQTPSTDLVVPGYDRSINKINLSEYLFANADGHNITIGIKENLIDKTDIDLQKRVQASVLASNEVKYHATVTSSLAGGAGNSFYTGKGVANKCDFYPSSFANLFPDSSHLLLQKKLTVQNHSYGTVIQPFYGAEALGYDIQTFNNKKLVHVFSSGNKGLDSATTGTYANLKGYGNLTGNFKMAKNIITVAAVDTSGRLIPFSSSGPIYDGRIGPQITALGPNGTSEAAAIISGTVAVMQQVYKDSNAHILPDASLIKAVLFTTADDIGRKGIDYNSGFGLVNVASTIHCLQQKLYDGSELNDGEQWAKTISLPAQVANFKVTLAWTDTAAAVNTNKAIVNDLDLEVIEMGSGTIYMPWQLSLFPHKDSLNKLPVRKRDSVNTSEMVSIEFPQAGLYKIKVNGKQVQTANKQGFHIAYSWDTLNKLRFTNPIHASDIFRFGNKNLAIKWKVSVADTTEKGILSVSFNNGIDWQKIASDIKLHNQRINWLLPNIPTQALLRMECSFGVFYSPPFVIAPLTKLKVDYLCDDLIRMSWQKHILATNYQVYALGDSAFIKPILTVPDTFVVINKNVFPENIYAVQPILMGDMKAARSEAVNILNQSVNCFYRRLLAAVVGDSIELDLDMSFWEGVTNIEFHKLSANGVWMKTITNKIPSRGQPNYRAYDHQPSNGNNYYRVKITIGETYIYTETVVAFHNGKKIVLIYPNPLRSGEKITFSTKDRMGAGTITITDILGRSIDNFTMNISGETVNALWPPGIYICIIRNTKGEIVETEKIIIQ